MPKYLLGKVEVGEIKVSRTEVCYMVDFIFPEGAKERLPYDFVAARTGRLPMQFYSVPQIGEIIEYKDIDWLITGVRHYPTKRYSRERKTIPLLILEYLGKTLIDELEK